MYNTALVTSAESEITVTGPAGRASAPLYSAEGLALVASLWLKVSFEHKLMYRHTWLGLPVIQLPNDLLLMQELIWRLRPDAIVECGLAHGGSAVFYASILELIGSGSVVGVDVEVRAYNRVAIENHPLAARIRIVEGSSVDDATVERVRELTRDARNRLIVLDSNHGYDHVRREMELYAGMVAPGGYLVVMDGSQAHLGDTPRGKSEWSGSHPLRAIAEFLTAHAEFEEDASFGKTVVTCSPRGFLRRRG